MLAATEGELGEILEAGQSFLGALLDLHWEGSRYEQFEPQERYDNTLRVLRTLILAEAKQKPTIFIIEDIHWLDSDSSEFINRLVRGVGKYPLAVLATSRVRPKSELPSIDGRPAQMLPLANLDRSSIEDLISLLLNGPAHSSLVELLAERAGGNPFILEQLLLYLRDADLLTEIEGGWAPSVEASDPTRLPRNVRQVFTARLDQLAPAVRDLVQTGAVLGREFELTILARIAEQGNVLAELNAAAEQASIWTSLSEMQYIFRHALLRDTAYEMQAQSRRWEIHHKAAQAHEELNAGDLNSVIPRIAYHYEAVFLIGNSEVRDEAIKYLQLAGEQAQSNFENSAALDYYARALTLLDGDDPEKRFDFLLARESVLDLQGAREAQRIELFELAATAKVLAMPAKEAEVWLRRARLAVRTNDYDIAIQAASSARELAETAGDVERQAEVQLWWGEALTRQAKLDKAQERLDSAFSLAEQAGARQIMADILRIRGIVHGTAGDMEPAQEAFENALTLCRELGNRICEQQNLNNVAYVSSRMGRVDEAYDRFQDALRLAEQAGNRLSELYALGNLTWNALILGDYSTGVSHAERALALSREIEHRAEESRTLANLCMGFQGLGDSVAALGYARSALELTQEIGDWDVQREALIQLGNALAALGDPKALDTFREVCEQARSQEDHELLAFALAGRLTFRQHTRGGVGSEILADLADLLGLLATHQISNQLGHSAILYLSAYRALAIWNESEASKVLQAGYQFIQAEAGKIIDDAKRSSYLEDVEANRELVVAGELLFGKVVPNKSVNLEAVVVVIRSASDSDLEKVRQTVPEMNGEEVSTVEAETVLVNVDDSGEDRIDADFQTSVVRPRAEETRLPPVSSHHLTEKRTDLSGAILTHAQLRGVRLVDALLCGIDLSKADLTGANLAGADLRGANLESAKLRGANLSNADLRGTDLSRADLIGANLDAINYDLQTHWPEGFSPKN